MAYCSRSSPWRKHVASQLTWLAGLQITFWNSPNPLPLMSMPPRLPGADGRSLHAEEPGHILLAQTGPDVSVLQASLA
jgi:hypothetical protein